MLDHKQQSANVTTFAPEMEGDITDRVGDHGFHSGFKRCLCAHRLFSAWCPHCVESISKANWGMLFAQPCEVTPKVHFPHLSLLIHWVRAGDSQLSGKVTNSATCKEVSRMPRLHIRPYLRPLQSKNCASSFCHAERWLLECWNNMEGCHVTTLQRLIQNYILIILHID